MEKNRRHPSFPRRGEPDGKMETIAMEILDEYTRYRIGRTVTEYDPSTEEYRNMLHLVAYDIREPSRLIKVGKTCKDFGIRVEYSVFECDLAEPLFNLLWQRLAAIIDHDDDRILVYRICGLCVTKIKSMGDISRPGKPLLYII